MEDRLIKAQAAAKAKRENGGLDRSVKFTAAEFKDAQDAFLRVDDSEGGVKAWIHSVVLAKVAELRALPVPPKREIVRRSVQERLADALSEVAKLQEKAAAEAAAKT